jgi:hypothetical protein
MTCIDAKSSGCQHRLSAKSPSAIAALAIPISSCLLQYLLFNSLRWRAATDNLPVVRLKIIESFPDPVWLQ